MDTGALFPVGTRTRKGSELTWAVVTKEMHRVSPTRAGVPGKATCLRRHSRGGIDKPAGESWGWGLLSAVPRGPGCQARRLSPLLLATLLVPKPRALMASGLFRT